MSRTYLELSAESRAEYKFYEVTVESSALTIRYGRIVVDGQKQTKTFADEAAVQLETEQNCARSAKKLSRRCDGRATHLRGVGAQWWAA